ncbi:MAG TPA: glycine cleavage system protein GcvH [Candidatus Altiarchaeales archaeon]|nr:glycine cleavage system protein GcvH [Candidatus Altiarchaeales archaeon]
MDFPKDLKYSEEHEWVKIKDGVATVGITDFAQDSLGDIVFAELPKPGKKVNAGDSVAVLESVKSVSDVYTPLGGEIVEVNEKLGGEPELINKSPYADGWMFKIKTSDSTDNLMDSKAYEEYAHK